MADVNRQKIKRAFVHGWHSEGETPCGRGSCLIATKEIRTELPHLITKYRVKTINDAGCGDFHWISHLKDFFSLNKINYMGYDIIDRKKTIFPFKELEITSEEMRPCDLIICRDVLIHLPNDMVLAAIDNFRKSGKFLLATSFPGLDNSKRSIKVGEFCRINLEGAPFNLGAPWDRIDEPQFRRFVGLWPLH